jgi:hypothetical protein
MPFSDQAIKPAAAHADSRIGNLPSISLETYRDLVDRCANEGLDYVIANGSAFHARILISKLFEVARREVFLVTGQLTVVNPEGVHIYGYPEVIEKAKGFLKDPISDLQIVVQTGRLDGGSQNEFLKAIINDEQRNGRVTLVIPETGTLGSLVPHFMVSDGSAYRLETGKDAQNRRDPHAITATANFGDAATAAKLKKYFVSLKTWLGDRPAKIYSYGERFEIA